MFPAINKRKTGINLRKIMDQHGITVKDVQEYLGLGSVQSVYHWLNGISMPSVDNLYALSELFQLPMDDLICGNRQAVSMSVSFIMHEYNYQRIQLYYVKICEFCNYLMQRDFMKSDKDPASSAFYGSPDKQAHIN